MAKKLKVELDVETSKAKQKLRQMGDDLGSGGPGGIPPAGGASDKLAKNLNKASESASQFNSQMVTVSRALVGIGTGLAMSYASRYFAEGSRARSAMDYGGSMLAGAAAGAEVGKFAGPKGVIVGSIVGAAGGAGKTYLDKSGEQAEKLKEFEKSEAIYAGIKAWQNKLRELSENLNKDEIQRILDNLKVSEAKFKAGATDAIKGERYQEAADYQRNLGDVRSRQEALEALLRQKPAATPRTSHDALDALGRIGGTFLGDAGGGESLRVEKDQLQVLKNIENKTGASAWQ